MCLDTLFIWDWFGSFAVCVRWFLVLLYFAFVILSLLVCVCTCGGFFAGWFCGLMACCLVSCFETGCVGGFTQVSFECLLILIIPVFC